MFKRLILLTFLVVSNLQASDNPIADKVKETITKTVISSAITIVCPQNAPVDLTSSQSITLSGLTFLTSIAAMIAYEVVVSGLGIKK